MTPKLESFVKQVLAISLASGVTYGMSGSNGFAASAEDILDELKTSTVKYAKGFKAKIDQQDLNALADKIEGNIMTLRVLDKLSDDLTNKLLSELHELSD